VEIAFPKVPIIDIMSSDSLTAYPRLKQTSHVQPSHSGHRPPRVLGCFHTLDEEALDQGASSGQRWRLRQAGIEPHHWSPLRAHAMDDGFDTAAGPGSVAVSSSKQLEEVRPITALSGGVLSPHGCAV